MKISPEAILKVLHEARHGTLATHSTQLPGFPYPTVTPYVVDDTHAPVICVSLLAEHTKNLLADARVGFSVRQPAVPDVQDAPRMTLLAVAERLEPTPQLLARYFRYAPKTEQLLALDFAFFRLAPKRIRFIAGFGQMGWLDECVWDALPVLPAPTETGFLKDASQRTSAGIRLLGADCFGIDYECDGQRRRQRFPDAPLSPERFSEAALRTATSLA